LERRQRVAAVAPDELARAPALALPRETAYAARSEDRPRRGHERRGQQELDDVGGSGTVERHRAGSPGKERTGLACGDAHARILPTREPHRDRSGHGHHRGGRDQREDHGAGAETLVLNVESAAAVPEGAGERGRERRLLEVETLELVGDTEN